MAKPSNITMRLRRAVGQTGFGRHRTLEGLVRHVLHAPELQRSSETGDRYVFLLHERVRRNGGVLLNLVVYTPNQAAQVLPESRRRRPTGVATHPPPQDAHYVQGSINYLIEGDDVFCARSGFKSDQALIAFVWQASRELGIQHADYQFALEDRVDVDAIATLQREGVKSLSFDGVASEIAVAEADRGSMVEGFLGSVLDQARSLFGAGRGVPTPDDRLKVHVSLALDRRHGGLEVDPFVFQLARRTLEDDDEGFKIVTSTNQTLTADKIKFTKMISLRRVGNHPDYEAAWEALVGFHDALHRRR